MEARLTVTRSGQSLTSVVNGLQSKLDVARKDVADQVKAEFESTVATWNNPAAFNEETAGNSTEVYTTNQIYSYLNDGTPVRYATMSPDFIAKTQPGRIAAAGGAGNVAYISKLHPKPGIAPRSFDKQIANKYRPIWAAKIRQVIAGLSQ